MKSMQARCRNPGCSFRRLRAQGWKAGEEPDVAAAIMGLFHLLPHSPKFLDQLVKLSLQLESVLHRQARACPSLMMLHAGTMLCLLVSSSDLDK